MEAKFKINLQLFSALGENLNFSFVVLDHLGRILFANEAAEELLQISEKSKKIFYYFEEKSTEKFNDIFNDHIASGTIQSNLIDLQLANGKEIKSKVTLTSYTEKKEFFIFCSFKPEELSINSRDISSVNVIGGDYKNIVNNKQILKIINEIKSLYPFTFIGKEKLRKDVDKLSELFWLKDKSGNIELVNKKFSDKLGVNSTILESQKFDDFIPAHLINFYKSIDNYINDSLNCIIIEGAPVKSLLQNQNYQTIQIPLNDADNNVIAIICVTQKIKEKEIKVKGNDFFNLNPNLLDEFPNPIAFFDSNGILKQKSEHFCKLFLRKLKGRKKLQFGEIFPAEITEKINSFLESNFESGKYTLTVNKQDDIEKSDSFEVVLHKLKFDNSKIKGFIFEANLVENRDDFESLLKRRGKMFDILIQNNPEPIFIYDKDNLKFLEVNDAALDLYGFRKDEFLKMDLTDLYTPEDIQSLLGTSSDNKHNTQFRGPYRHRIKNGSIIFVEISKISFMYKGKEAHFNIIKDVTKNLTLEMKNREFKAVYDNTTDLLFSTEQTGFIKFANDKALEFLDTTDKKIIGISFVSLFVDEDRSNINNKIFNSKSLDPIKIKAKFRKNIGEPVQVELTATPIIDFEGNIETFTIIGVVKKPEIVKQIEVERSPASFETDKKQIDSSFFSSLFHEILTPINVILGFVQDLTSNLKQLTPEQKETSKIIDQNRIRLLETMNSVIEYSNILNNVVQLNITEIGIPEIIDNLRKENDEIEENHKKEFTYGKISSSLNFESDLPRFQTLASLLFKTISILSTKDKLYFSAVSFGDDSFLISIKDSYSSLSEELYGKIVDLFANEEKISSDVFGLSVLTIRLTKALLKLLKGKFHSDETENKNCGFIFPLKFKLGESPLEDQLSEIKETEPQGEKTKKKIVKKIEVEPSVEKEEQVQVKTEKEIKIDTVEDEPTIAEESISASISDFDLSELKCLYIEDQVDSQILFKVQMKELKEIKFAVSFEEALPLLDSERFDFIVMDINLQGEYNGLDALKIIKRMPGYENTPIIAVTAYVLPGDREKFIATGFEDFISKPIFREKMVSTLERIFVEYN